MKRKRNVDPDAPVTSTKFRAAEHRIVSVRCGKGKKQQFKFTLTQPDDSDFKVTKKRF